MPKIPKVRLPNYIRPERYEIFLKPDLQGFVFEGEEIITLNIEKPTKEITLHSKELEILSTEYQVSSIKYHVLSQKVNTKLETITFKFNKQLPIGHGQLTIKFKGVLSDKLKGFYRSKFLHQGVEKYIATTQFEATDARTAFPCFDEPAHKAVFDVTFLVPKELTVISNTVEESIIYHSHDQNDQLTSTLSGQASLAPTLPFEHQAGYKIVKFAPTPKMSTYLLAFIVGDFEWIEGYTNSNPPAGRPISNSKSLLQINCQGFERKKNSKTLVRVFTTPGKKHQAKFALETAIKVLEFYEKYFNIPYPLPTLDLIAIPDFASAAMENWGAITYRETALLVDEEHTSAANRQWVAIVIAHELAHQWFGNLVTMHWWTDLWLNEGFASYMEYLAVDNLFPEWQIWQQYVSGRFATALKLDSLKNTHPIEVKVNHPSEIWEIFDAVSYAKGSAVIRMLAEFLGPKNFQRGLQHYLITHAYKNTTTKDLWKAFQDVSKMPVIKLMQNWTKKAGHPVISAEQKNGKIILSQKRFYSSEISRKSEKDQTLWQIPVSYLIGPKKLQTVFLQSKSLKLKLPKKFEFIKFNFGENGVYRVLYDTVLLQKLEQAILQKQLPVIDRLGLIRDSFNLAQAGQFSTIKALEFAKYFNEEKELVVLEELAAGLLTVYGVFDGGEYQESLKKYFLQIIQKNTREIGFSTQTKLNHISTLKRSLLLSLAGFFGDPEIIHQAKNLFKTSNKNLISVDIRSVVYSLSAQNGGSKEFNELIKMYNNSNHLHEEQERIGKALGQFKQINLLKRALKFALSHKVRIQDQPSLFLSIARNPYGRSLAFTFLREHWEEIEKTFNTGGHLLEWFVLGFSGMNSQKEALEFENLFKKHKTLALGRTVRQVLEKIKSNVAWKKREEKNLQKFISLI